MEGSKLGLYVTRTFQLIFAIIVLGVSAHLAAEINGACDEYSAYATFTGAFGTLGAIVGLVAFMTAIPGIVALVFDALATIFYLAGGINSAVLRGDGSCEADFCREWTASTAFMFLGVFVSLVAVILVCLTRRSQSKTSAV